VRKPRERERLNAVPSVSDVGNTLVQAQEPRRGSKLSRRPDKTTHRHTLIAAEKQSTGSRDDALREDKKQINDGASARETESETRRKKKFECPAVPLRDEQTGRLKRRRAPLAKI
jgi:hypothetical protein